MKATLKAAQPFEQKADEQILSQILKVLMETNQRLELIEREELRAKEENRRQLAQLVQLVRNDNFIG